MPGSPPTWPAMPGSDAAQHPPAPAAPSTHQLAVLGAQHHVGGGQVAVHQPAVVQLGNGAPHRHQQLLQLCSQHVRVRHR